MSNKDLDGGVDRTHYFEKDLKYCGLRESGSYNFQSDYLRLNHLIPTELPLQR